MRGFSGLLGVPSRLRRDWKAAAFAAFDCCNAGMTLGYPHVLFAVFCWLYAGRFFGTWVPVHLVVGAVAGLRSPFNVDAFHIDLFTLAA